MPYDSVFYDIYRDYLQEETVRRNHDRMFAHFYKYSQGTPLLVADLGCGLGEYSLYGFYNQYVGVDANNTANYVKNFIHVDYHKEVLPYLLPFVPTAFVSLFSIECCHSAKDKYALYENLFARMPSLKYGLVGGFFYQDSREMETIGETEGIISYQTIEDPSLYISLTFSEFRLHMRTPSIMFGSDVIEVWKIFSRLA